MSQPVPYDALLVLSFGGPEGPADVLPFLENVLRGRNVPRQRMLEVAEHYQHFGGKSPLNDQNRELIRALSKELGRRGVDLPIYFGNRNWHPLLTDTLEQMRRDGRRRVLAYVTSAFSSYSGCRQYLEDLERARGEITARGEGDAPRIDKLRVFFNHPGFIETLVQRVNEARQQLPADVQTAPMLLFTAHSVPQSMAATSDYVAQLRETSRLVAQGAGLTRFDLVYQSRSGPPTQPWLEPDVCDYLRALPEPRPAMILVPIGFLSDHLEVMFDLDQEAAQCAKELGISMVRSLTPGASPRFVLTLADLIQERIAQENGEAVAPLAIGKFPARGNECAAGCCPSPGGRGGTVRDH